MLSRFVIEQASFNFMAVFAVCSDFWSPRKRSLLLFLLFPHLFTLKRWDWMVMIFIFWMLSFKPVFSVSSFTFRKRLFSSSLLSARSMVSSAYLSLLIFFLAIFPACASSSSAFHMTYSAYKENKQSDNTQPWHTPFPILNQSIVPCPVLTVGFLTCIQVSQEAGKVVWYSCLFKNFIICYHMLPVYIPKSTVCFSPNPDQ